MKRILASTPRHYAAASLKLVADADDVDEVGVYSAALRRGLIEALPSKEKPKTTSLVLRGITPRPH